MTTHGTLPNDGGQTYRFRAGWASWRSLLLLLAACSTDPAAPARSDGEGEGEAAGSGAAGGEGEGEGETDERSPDGGESGEGEGEGEARQAVVRVVDEAGDPVEGAFVLAAGTSDSSWLVTDATGVAAMPPPGDPNNEPIVTAAKRGWWSGGNWRPEPGEGDLLITLRKLPAPAETTYEFDLAGSADDMGGTDRCMHCHPTLGEQWNTSAHKRAQDNPLTLALYDAAVAQGAAAAETCGDCHGIGQAAPGGRPEGGFDLRGGGDALRGEGVTCDICHKIADSRPDPARPGVQGSVSLLLPSLPSPSPVSEYEPIQFGPHGDVLNPFMGGAYQPQFRQAVLCAGCHSLHQPVPGGPDPRWPDGLPLLTTWQEWQASAFAPDVPCQSCHMTPLDEETGAGSLTEDGWTGGISLGFVRPEGEVRRHDWPSVAELGPDAVALTLELTDDPEAGELVATVRVTNLGAGHALPTGEPLRQLAVLVRSSSGPSVGGRAIPVHGGAVRVAAGREVDYAPATASFGFPAPGLPDGPSRLRVLRPLGEWDDYEGPGVGWFSSEERDAEDKGLPLHRIVADVAIEESSADAVRVAQDEPIDLQPDDLVLLVADDDWGGDAGWLWAKTLADESGRAPVHHGAAATIVSDNRLASGATATTTHTFPLPAEGGEATVEARLIYRAVPSPIARATGQPTRDLELATATAPWPPEGG